MELRERIERLICDGVWAKDGHGNSHTRIVGASVVADAILDIPEIKEALRSQCSSCDGARGPLLCTECIRDFIKAA